MREENKLKVLVLKTCLLEDQGRTGKEQTGDKVELKTVAHSSTPMPVAETNNHHTDCLSSSTKSDNLETDFSWALMQALLLAFNKKDICSTWGDVEGY